MPTSGSRLRRLGAWVWRRLFGAGNAPPLLFLALVAFLNLLLVGYEFAVNDQLLYLALVPRYFDPTLLHPQDLYLELFVSRTHTTLFLMLAPLLRWVDWEWPVFILYAVVKFFIFWGVWSLAWGLTRDRWAAALAVVFLLWNAYMKELSVQFYSFTLICRYAVIPLLFFGLRRFWDRRYLASAVLFGLAFQVHAMTTIYWLIIGAFCFLWNIQSILWVDTPGGGRRFNRTEARRLLLALGVFVVLALPMLVWRWLTPMPEAPAEFTRLDWFEYSYVWKGEYIFYSLWNRPHLWAFLLGLVFLVLPLWQLRRDGAARWYGPTALGALAVMAAHYVVTELVPFQPLYQLQWYRASDVLPLLAAIGVARVVSAEAVKPWPWVPAAAAACFLVAVTSEGSRFLFSVAAILLLIVMPFEKKRRLLSSLLVVFGVLPAAIWLQFSGEEAGGLANGWTTPVCWAVIVLVVMVVLYSRTWLESGVPSVGWARRLVAGGVCALGLALLALAAFHAPEWRGRGWYRTARPATRLTDCLARLNSPGRALDNDSVRLQHWVRTNTPPQAMVFVPPGLNGFRVFSERSVFVEYFDGEVGVFSAKMAYTWRERIRMFGYDPTQKKGLGHAWGAYHRLMPQQWRDLSKQYGADYLVTRSRAKLPFELLRQEGYYTLWRITEEVTEEK